MYVLIYKVESEKQMMKYKYKDDEHNKIGKPKTLHRYIFLYSFF